MANSIKMVQGDRYPLITITLKDRGDPNADPNDPDTWPIVDLSTGIDGIRVEYYQSDLTLIDVTDSTNDEFGKEAHGLLAGDRVRFSTSGTLPVPLDENVLYYVIDSTAGANADFFKVSTTEGGSAVDITVAGVGQLNVIKLFDTATGTIVGGGGGGQFTYTHPNLVWENPGDYLVEYVVRLTGPPAGKETVYDKDNLEIRRR